MTWKDQVFDDLALQFIDGNLTATDAQRLDQRLKHDHAACVRFAQLAEVHRSLGLRADIEAVSTGQRGRSRRRSRRSRRVRSARRTQAPAVLVVLAAVLVVAFVWSRYAIEERSETDFHQAVEAHWQGANGTAMDFGQRVHAGAERLVLNRSDEQTAVALEPNSVVQIQDSQRLQLEDGTVVVQVAAQRDGRSLVIATQHAEARVIGTEFSVTAGAAQTELRVQEGEVRFDGSTGRQFVLRAGERMALPSPALATDVLSSVVQQPEASPRITNFIVIDADTDRPVQPLANGEVLNLAQLPTRRLNIVVTTVGRPQSVALKLNGKALAQRVDQFEGEPPYSLAGDASRGNGTGRVDFNAWEPARGDHVLEVTLFADLNGRGAALDRQQLRFTVIEE